MVRGAVAAPAEGRDERGSSGAPAWGTGGQEARAGAVGEVPSGVGVSANPRGGAVDARLRLPVPPRSERKRSRTAHRAPRSLGAHTAAAWVRARLPARQPPLPAPQPRPPLRGGTRGPWRPACPWAASPLPCPAALAQTLGSFSPSPWRGSRLAPEEEQPGTGPWCLRRAAPGPSWAGRASRGRAPGRPARCHPGRWQVFPGLVAACVPSWQSVGSVLLPFSVLLPGHWALRVLGVCWVPVHAQQVIGKGFLSPGLWGLFRFLFSFY